MRSISLPRVASHPGRTCVLCIAVFLGSSVVLAAPRRAEPPEGSGSDVFDDTGDGSDPASAQPPADEPVPDVSLPEEAPAEPPPGDAVPATPAPAPAAAPKRLRVPPAAAIADAEKLVREAFGDTRAKRGQAERLALAQKLLEQAGEAAHDDPATRYVLLRDARDLAAAAGDVAVAMSAAEEMVAAFRVKRAETKLAALPPAGKANDAAELARVLVAISNDGIAEEDWAAATKAASMAAVAAGRVREDKALALRARAQPGVVTRGKKLAAAAADARKKLDADPDDPKANLLLGRYLCFSRGDWPAGVAHLAKSADPALKDVARRELSAPEDAAEMGALADAWWAAAEAAPKDDAGPMRVRAASWYRLALPDLTGIRKAMAETRIAEGLAGDPRERGKTVNLLAVLDPGQDVVAGVWRMTPEGLTSDAAHHSRVALPYEPPEDYDFEVEFTRVGEDTVVVMFVVAGKPVMWVMGGWNDTIFAFQAVNGQAGDQRNPTTVKASLQTGRRYACVVKVRKGTAQAYLDGRRMSQCDAGTQALSLPAEWALSSPGILGFGTYASTAVFHSIRVVEISGPGKLLR